jgi:hypothetical protein
MGTNYYYKLYKLGRIVKEGHVGKMSNGGNNKLVFTYHKEEMDIVQMINILEITGVLIVDEYGKQYNYEQFIEIVSKCDMFRWASGQWT